MRVAVLMADTDGNNGLGVSHWVAYNTPSDLGQLKQNEGTTESETITLGINVTGKSNYLGMCPKIGAQPHHYILSVIATDLPPASLPKGLTREALLIALKEHALASNSIVGTYRIR